MPVELEALALAEGLQSEVVDDRRQDDELEFIVVVAAKLVDHRNLIGPLLAEELSVEFKTLARAEELSSQVGECRR